MQSVTNHEVLVKVTDTNHERRGHKPCLRRSPWQVHDQPICVPLMEFSSLQCTGKVGNDCCGHKSRKFATQIMKVGDMICVADFHDLCPRLSPRGSFGESREVGVMEFGL